MRGLGTIINVAAVVAGSMVGMLIRTGLKQRFQDILIQACGLATMFIGIAGTLAGLLKVVDGGVETQNTMLLVFSLVIGGLLGECIDIELRLDHLGIRLQHLAKADNNSMFVEGFVTASLVICVGAMAIVGSIQDGLTGDYSMLCAKAVLDMVIVMVFASTMGIGVLFSALPLGIYQGLITLCAVLIAPFLSEGLIQNMSFVGSALIFCVGYNLIFGKKIKVGNLLPAILIPVFWEILQTVVGIA
jgi:uncharacterized protein